MIRKMYLATSALVAATQMAFAAQYGRLPPGQTPATIRQLQRDVLTRKGMILNRNGIPIAVQFPVTSGKNGAHGKAVEPPPVVPGKDCCNFSKSKNALFLSWFGWFVRDINSSFNSSYSYCISYNSTYTQCLNYEHIKYSDSITLVQSAAQPFTHVETADSISVAVGGGKGKVAIYHNTAKCANSTTPSCPGAPVPGASGTFSAPSGNGLCCQDMITVNFAAVSLRKKKTYWVVMSADVGNSLVWYGQDSNFTMPPTGEDYKYTETVKFHETYRTSKSGHSGTYHSTGNYSSNGWIHTKSFSFGEQQAAFCID